MTTDPVIVAACAIALFAWSFGGALIWIALRSTAPDPMVRACLAFGCGPVAWGLAGYAAFKAFRERALSRIGMPSYGCCGGHGDSEPSAYGTRNDGHGCRKHGYHSDTIINSP